MIAEKTKFEGNKILVNRERIRFHVSFENDFEVIAYRK
jgi:hypothetical protein